MRECLDGVLAAVATVLGSAERQTQDAPEIVVDEDHTDIDSTRHAQGTLGVARVNAGEQALLGRVGDRDGLLFRLERGHGHHWSKDLLLRDARVGPHISQQRRRHEESAA